MTKYLLIVIILFSSAFSEGPGNKQRNKWHKKKHKNNKQRIHRLVHRPKSNIKIKYGYHWCLTPWKKLYSRHSHNNVVVLKNEEKIIDNSSDIFAKIEQLGALKQGGKITKKESQKAKKELLKRI